MGFSKEEIEKLNEDEDFTKAVSELSTAVSSEVNRYVMLTGYGLQIGEGKRIELRNVAMSDVGEILDQPELLAKSRTAQVMADGKLMDGVAMKVGMKAINPNVGNAQPEAHKGDENLVL